MQAQLEAIEPGSFDGLLRYLAEGNLHYHVSLQHFVGRNFYSWLDYFSPRNLPLLFKLKALVKHYDNVGHYFQHPYLKAAFTFQDMYLGLSPYDALATYSLIQYTELADGVWFPMGGLYRVIESLASIAEAQGVRFMYNTPVKQIEVDGKRATGLLLQDGSRLSADVIVANADLPYVYRHLLPDKAEAERLERLKYTCSAIMFYWGVDQVYPQLGHHNVFLGGDYRASFDRIFKEHTLPDEPSFYVHAPARTDPAAAPAGQDTLMVLVPVGHVDEAAGQDWEGLQARARSAVLRRLADVGVTDLEQHLKFEVSYTPCDWLSMYNLAKGAAFGLSHNFFQVGYSAAAEPARPLSQPVLCRRKHPSGHRPADGAPVGPSDHRAHSERDAAASTSSQREACGSGDTAFGVGGLRDMGESQTASQNQFSRRLFSGQQSFRIEPLADYQ